MDTISHPFPKRFPWSTLGRRETDAEFFLKWSEQKERAEFFSIAPHFSIVLYGECDLEGWELSLNSLIYQSYENWTAIVVPVENQRLELTEKIEKLGDARISIVEDDYTDLASLKPGTGDFAGFLKAGQVLSPVNLYHCVLELNRHPETDLFYFDEAVVDGKLRKVTAHLGKPEFSWATLVHHNYVGTTWWVKRALYDQVRFDSVYGSNAMDQFLLTLSEQSCRFRLVPFYLLYRGEEPKSLPNVRYQNWLVGHFQKMRGSASVTVLEKQGVPYLKIKPEPKFTHGLISVVICFRDKADWTLKAIQSVLAQVGHVPIELVLVNNQSCDEELKKIESFLPSLPCAVKLVHYDAPFNFNRMHNLAIREHCIGDAIFLLNNDVFLSGEGMLDSLYGWSQFEDIGTVGILLRYNHGGIQHEGIRAYFGGEARMARVGHLHRPDPLTYESREVFANTFAACMFRKALYESLGGLRETELANGFGDVAFNFEAVRKGCHNLYLGHLEGVHLESASRGMSYEYWEEFTIEREYPDILQKMLRADLGWNLVPSPDPSLWTVMRNGVLGYLKRNAPWLDPLKPKIKKVFYWLSRSRRSLYPT